MNVYQKLNEAREEFHLIKLQKTGHNTFAKYFYFELGDFLIPALSVFKKFGLTSVISFGPDLAVMKIINSDKLDEIIEITCPMSEANLKGCHPVQNLGAVQTYTRRYLWVAALEIVEHDAIDPSEPLDKDKKKSQSPIQTITTDQVTEINELIEETKSDTESLLNWVSKNANTTCTEVSMIPEAAYIHVKKILAKKTEKAAK
jgi:hypothetical protein